MFDFLFTEESSYDLLFELVSSFADFAELFVEFLTGYSHNVVIIRDIFTGIFSSL